MNSEKKDGSRLDTTMVELTNDETVTAQASGSRTDGFSMDQLVANYHAIIDQQGIYYPVAYRFLRELGRGRQGIVFLGLRQGARGCITRHAIKLFDPQIYPSAKKYWTDMGRIAAQTSQLQTVRSPNLVARDVYEETNGIGYLQMEAVDGVTLRYFLDGRHLAKVRDHSTPAEWNHFTDVIFRVEDGGRPYIQPGIALYIMRQILRGLETLHEMGFVHCDVKPSNIMIDRLGYVKLIDYGRAVRVNEKPTFLLGSPMYMAPEVHRRENSTIQGDIYSVGLVGLEMLSGRPLVERAPMSESDLLELKMHLPERLVEILPNHVRQNEHLVYLLHRFIEPDPSRRYGSAGEAESGEGLRQVHRQLTQLGKDTEYGRELQDYLAKLLPSKKMRDQNELTAL